MVKNEKHKRGMQGFFLMVSAVNVKGRQTAYCELYLEQVGNVDKRNAMCRFGHQHKGHLRGTVVKILNRF